MDNSQSFCLTVAPLSRESANTIDEFAETEPVDAPVVSLVQSESKMMRRLRAAETGQPSWTDIDKVSRLNLSASLAERKTCWRHLSSSCLASVIISSLDP
jgi:hypothetical protein